MPTRIRELTVISHAELVDSTALAKRDADLAHDLTRTAFRRMASVFEGYGGTVLESRGDALVARFVRASDAVCAAVDYQTQEAQLRAENGEEPDLYIRIGLKIGRAHV